MRSGFLHFPFGGIGWTGAILPFVRKSPAASGTPAYVEDKDSVRDAPEPEIVRGMPVYDSLGRVDTRAGVEKRIIAIGDGATWMALYVYDREGNCVAHDDEANLMTRDDRIQTVFERRDVERPFEAHRGGNVVPGAVRVHLRERPLDTKAKPLAKGIVEVLGDTLSDRGALGHKEFAARLEKIREIQRASGAFPLRRADGLDSQRFRHAEYAAGPSRPARLSGRAFHE